MTLYIGIERSTDLQRPDVKISKFQSRRRAIEWARGGGGFADPGAAREDIRPTLQNWHHRHRYVYEMPPGFRLNRAEVSRLAKREWQVARGSIYMRDRNQIEASLYMDAGKEIDVREEARR